MRLRTLPIMCWVIWAGLHHSQGTITQKSIDFYQHHFSLPPPRLVWPYPLIFVSLQPHNLLKLHSVSQPLSEHADASMRNAVPNFGVSVLSQTPALTFRHLPCYSLQVSECDLSRQPSSREGPSGLLIPYRNASPLREGQRILGILVCLKILFS